MLQAQRYVEDVTHMEKFKVHCVVFRATSEC